MSRNIDREEALLKAAELVRLKREREAREDREFYERITSGIPWLSFKLIVAFSLLIVVLSSIDFFVDGSTKKLTQNDWKVDKNWEWRWHKVLDVEGAMFAPRLENWSGHIDESMTLIYSPVFHSPKKLRYTLQVNEDVRREHVEMRDHSVFNWFPEFQILLLIPLFTYLFKRQKPWFNFARIFSMFVIFPGTLLVLYFTIF